MPFKAVSTFGFRPPGEELAERQARTQADGARWIWVPSGRRAQGNLARFRAFSTVRPGPSGGHPAKGPVAFRQPNTRRARAEARRASSGQGRDRTSRRRETSEGASPSIDPLLELNGFTSYGTPNPECREKPRVEASSFNNHHIGTQRRSTIRPINHQKVRSRSPMSTRHAKLIFAASFPSFPSPEPSAGVPQPSRAPTCGVSFLRFPPPPRFSRTIPTAAAPANGCRVPNSYMRIKAPPASSPCLLEGPAIDGWNHLDTRVTGCRHAG